MAASDPMENGIESLSVVSLLINGKETTSNPSSQFPIYSYERQKNVGMAESANVTTARAACDAAQEAFKTWKRVTAIERHELLLRYDALLRSHSSELIAVQHAETSVPEKWCRKNIDLATGLIEGTAACITSLEGEILQTEMSESLALALTVPVGPVLIIAPWSSPIILGARNFATAVAAGCSVVFKASELCPRLHHLLFTIFNEQDFQPASEVTEAMIAHPAIRKVEFVGSAAVGKIFGQLCAKYLKPILMELGGKGSALVLDDADLPAAARKCALPWAAFCIMANFVNLMPQHPMSPGATVKSPNLLGLDI